MLPNGWALSPAGESLPLGDLPLNMAISKSKKWMAVTNNGQSTQTIQLINTLTDKIEDNIVVDKAWLGLAFSKDEKYLYASGGNDNWILQYAIAGNKLKLLDSIKLGDKWPNKISPAGICIDDNNVLFVVTKDDNALYSINLNSKKTLTKNIDQRLFDFQRCIIDTLISNLLAYQLSFYLNRNQVSSPNLREHCYRLLPQATIQQFADGNLHCK